MDSTSLSTVSAPISPYEGHISRLSYGCIWLEMRFRGGSSGQTLNVSTAGWMSDHVKSV